jgi:hypothetical protein
MIRVLVVNDRDRDGPDPRDPKGIMDLVALPSVDMRVLRPQGRPLRVTGVDLLAAPGRMGEQAFVYTVED